MKIGGQVRSRSGQVWSGQVPVRSPCREPRVFIFLKRVHQRVGAVAERQGRPPTAPFATLVFMFMFMIMFMFMFMFYSFAAAFFGIFASLRFARVTRGHSS